MRHKRKVKHFSRKSGPRKALLRGLVVALVENGRIKTTVEKAKEVRRHIEKAITLGKKGDLASRRLLLSRYPNTEAVKGIVDEIAPRFATRNGGYTRIIRVGRRAGDSAEMAFLEFVDYDFKAVADADETGTKESATKKAPVKKAKVAKAKTAKTAAKKKAPKAEKSARA